MELTEERFFKSVLIPKTEPPNGILVDSRICRALRGMAPPLAYTPGLPYRTPCGLSAFQMSDPGWGTPAHQS